MADITELYKFPFGYSGVGSDIRWCKRWSGGKFCIYCRHHAKFEEWSEDWHWYYLLQWTDAYYGWWGWKEYAHFRVNTINNIWYGFGYGATRQQIPKPKRYRTIGIKETDLKSLLRKGCKKNRKCKCVSVAQRGAWYCPKCYCLMKRMAKHRGTSFHELTITDRNEIKEDVLILLLSGTI